ncbi:MAG: 50S ribosomal protein L28 [Candidatus Sericytochromatia bacterium]
MSQVCEVTGKKHMVSNHVSHSHRRTKYKQKPNLQWKKFFVPELNKTVRLRVSTTAIKTISKYGLISTLKRYGTDLSILNR